MVFNDDEKIRDDHFLDEKIKIRSFFFNGKGISFFLWLI